MANETEYSNFITVQAYLDTAIAPVFRAQSVMLNLVHLVNFKSMSDSVKLRKKGSLTATAATESTAHAISEYTQTSPATLTAAEVKVYTEISDKAIEFIDRPVEELRDEISAAIAQKFDTDVMALFDTLNGGTQVGTSGAALTAAIMLQANYILQAQNIPGSPVYVLNPRQIYDVQGQIIASSAPVWTSTTTLTLLNGQPPQANGFRGQFLGMDVFQSTNTESVNAAADWAGAHFSPTLALAVGMLGSVKTKIGYNVQKGVTELAGSLWYDAKEYNDLAGVSIETDQ